MVYVVPSAPPNWNYWLHQCMARDSGVQRLCWHRNLGCWLEEQINYVWGQTNVSLHIAYNAIYVTESGSRGRCQAHWVSNHPLPHFPVALPLPRYLYFQLCFVWFMVRYILILLYAGDQKPHPKQKLCVPLWMHCCKQLYMLVDVCTGWYNRKTMTTEDVVEEYVQR
jgi:hypothetical protein